MIYREVIEITKGKLFPHSPDLCSSPGIQTWTFSLDYQKTKTPNDIAKTEGSIEHWMIDIHSTDWIQSSDVLYTLQIRKNIEWQEPHQLQKGMIMVNRRKCNCYDNNITEGEKKLLLESDSARIQKNAMDLKTLSLN
ncbi:hypothetical protein DITRI_Ditri05aG0065800 [Diplodiscus trichospermus]